MLKLRYYAYHNTENIFKWKDSSREQKKVPALHKRWKSSTFPTFYRMSARFSRRNKFTSRDEPLPARLGDELSATTELHLQNHKQQNSSKLPKLLHCKKQTAPALLGTTKNAANSPADIPLKASYVHRLFAFTLWMPILESTPAPTPSPFSWPSTVPITCKKPAFIKWQPPYHVVHPTCGTLKQLSKSHTSIMLSYYSSSHSVSLNQRKVLMFPYADGGRVNIGSTAWADKFIVALLKKNWERNPISSCTRVQKTKMHLKIAVGSECQRLGHIQNVALLYAVFPLQHR